VIREYLATQIELLSSVSKSSFLSSIASITTAIQIWNKFSANAETKDKPELRRLIWVLGVQTYMSVTLLVVQTIDNSWNRREMYMSRKRQVRDGAIFALLTLTLLLIDAGLEGWEIKLMM
jgi:hypothetical protein